MLKKFLKSKVFVLSVLAASCRSDVQGMDLTDIRYFLNNTQDQTQLSVLPIIDDSNTSSCKSDVQGIDLTDIRYFLNNTQDQAQLSVLPKIDDFNTSANEKAIFDQPENPAFDPLLPFTYDSNIFVFQTNVNPEMSFNISANHPVRNPRYYPPNWDSSGAGQVLDNYESTHRGEYKSLRHLYLQVKELAEQSGVYVRSTCTNQATVLEMRQWFVDNWNIIKDRVNEAIQTNPQIRKTGQTLFPDGWKGSDAERFCINYGLADICRIGSFVAKMRALGYQVQAIPNGALKGRRVFMYEVYPVLATLSEEEIQKIANYKRPSKKTPDGKLSLQRIQKSSAINKQWKESKIGKWCEQQGIKGRDKLWNWYTVFIAKNPDLNFEKPTWSEYKSPVSLKRLMLRQFTAANELEIAPRLTRMLQNPQ